LDPSLALGNLPDGLRKELLDEFNGVVRNFRERKWKPSELDVGRLCEVVYSILRGHVDGKFPKKASKPKNMVTACQAFEHAGTGFPRAVKITMPRVLISLYDFRNNRGVGHVGGDVDANHMDAVFALGGSKWLIAELIRVFHAVNIKTATDVVDALSDRTIPIIFEVAGKKRVLRPELSMKDKTLLLLYSQSQPITEEVLADWIEHSNRSVYRKDVLKPMHKAKLIEFDGNAGAPVHLLPPGVTYVEDNLLQSL
jgi:hypothetical protein